MGEEVEEEKEEEEDEDSLLWQVAPSQPAAQMHRNRLTLSMHVPPFRQGAL